MKGQHWRVLNVGITLKEEERCERTTLEGVGITLKEERGVKG